MIWRSLTTGVPIRTTQRLDRSDITLSRSHLSLNVRKKTPSPSDPGLQRSIDPRQIGFAWVRRRRAGRSRITIIYNEKRILFGYSRLRPGCAVWRMIIVKCMPIVLVDASNPYSQNGCLFRSIPPLNGTPGRRLPPLSGSFSLRVRLLTHQRCVYDVPGLCAHTIYLPLRCATRPD